MRVLVLASLTAPATANYLISALREAGHQLFVCSDVDSPFADLKASGAVHVARVCAQHCLAPDLVFFVEGGTMRLFPIGLEEMHCLTVWYGIDTHMDYAKHLRIGRLFDVTFVAQKEFVESLHKDGLRQVQWLPLAFAPELYPAETLERIYDVAYVGSNNATLHPVRHALLTSIQKEFPHVFMGTAKSSDMARIYAQAKLVFNKSVNNDVNMRYFEAMGGGAVLLTDPALNNGVDELFRVGEHYFEYLDEQTLLTLIRSLLKDPERCRLIGDAARRHVLANHTYRHRVEQLLETMTHAVKLPAPQPADYFPALMSLGLLNAALHSVGHAASICSGGKQRKLVGRVTNIFMITLAVGLSLLERLRDFFRSV